MILGRASFRGCPEGAVLTPDTESVARPANRGAGVARDGWFPPPAGATAPVPQ